MPVGRTDCSRTRLARHACALRSAFRVRPCQMRRFKQQALRAAGTIVLLVCSCSTPSSKDLQAKAIRLQKAQLIEVDIFVRGTMRLTKVHVEPAVLEKVRSWINEHAWPPIDPRATGAVAPRGYFTIFESASDTSFAYRIYVYGSTSRTEPTDVHVSNEAWQALLKLLSVTK